MSILPIIVPKINPCQTLDFFDFAGYGHFTMKTDEKNEIKINKSDRLIDGIDILISIYSIKVVK